MIAFESGFLSGALSAGVGGTTSVLRSGKSANGAVIAAFATMFNDMKHKGANAIGVAVAPAAIEVVEANPIAGITLVAAGIGGAIKFVYDFVTSPYGGAVFNSDDGVVDIDGGSPPVECKPTTIVRGKNQTRQYEPDGFAQTDRDLGHPNEKGVVCGDHCHDWGRPADGSRRTNVRRSLSRLPRPGDPPPPRGYK